MIINNKIYFIHIPRTAGRFLQDSLALNEHNITSFSFNTRFKGKEVPHLTYPEYCQFTHYRNFKKFCIVRDPVDRFLSMANTWMLDEEQLDKMFKDQSYFDQTLNNICLNSFTNWFVPQHQFIDYKTKVWRFENGFKLEFSEWLLETFDIEIKKIASKSNYLNSDEREIDLNDKQIGFIKDYYYKDYKILEY
jgi:hypothetical protein